MVGNGSCLECEGEVGELMLGESVWGEEEVVVFCQQCLHWQNQYEERLKKEIEQLEKLLGEQDAGDSSWEEQQLEEEVEGGLEQAIVSSKQMLLQVQAAQQQLINTYHTHLLEQTSLYQQIQSLQKQLHSSHLNIKHTSQIHSLLDNHLTYLSNLEPLSQLYPIYCDNHWAYINGEAITWQTLHPLLELVTLLAQSCNYAPWYYHPPTSTVTHNGCEQVYTPESQRKSIGVLHCVVGGVMGMWKEIGKGEELPFKCEQQPVVIVHKMAFSNSSTYSNALRYLVSDVKFMMEMQWRHSALPPDPPQK